MSVLEVEQLLEPVSAESPCGENLEYDADFQEMERGSQGTPEQQFGDTVIEAQSPDWKTVRGKALELFQRTKDLRVAVYLARAVVRLDGLPGFCDALALIRGLVDRFWQEVHPQLDPEDDLDPALRVNALAALCDSDACLRPVHEMSIVESASLGKFSYRDYLVACGDMPPRAEETPPEKTTIESAFLDADPDQLVAWAQATAAALADAEGIESALTEQVGALRSTSFDSLTDVLKKISQILAGQVERRGLGAQPEEPAAEETSGGSGEGGAGGDLDLDALIGGLDSGAAFVAGPRGGRRDQIPRRRDPPLGQDLRILCPIRAFQSRASAVAPGEATGFAGFSLVAARIGAKRFVGGRTDQRSVGVRIRGWKQLND